LTLRNSFRACGILLRPAIFFLTLRNSFTLKKNCAAYELLPHCYRQPRIAHFI
jgi:hypothetical protein